MSPIATTTRLDAAFRSSPWDVVQTAEYYRDVWALRSLATGMGSASTATPAGPRSSGSCGATR
jgi:hypothetical protein